MAVSPFNLACYYLEAIEPLFYDGYLLHLRLPGHWNVKLS